MRNLLALLGLLVVVFAVVGWYCGWYTVKINRETDGTLQINANVDTDKAVNDTSGFLHKAGEFVGQHGEKGQPSSTDKTPAPAKDNAFDGGWLLSPSKPAGGNR